MTAVQRRRAKCLFLSIIFVLMIVILLILMKVTLYDTPKFDFACDEKYVYWSGNKLVTQENTYTYKEDILNYRDGIAETQSYYYYKEKEFNKPQIKYITADYLLRDNGEIYSTNGEFIRKDDDAMFIFNDIDDVGTIKEEYLYTKIYAEPIYLGGKVKELIEDDDRLYMISEYAPAQDKNILVVYNKDDAMIENVLEISQNEHMQQVVDNIVFMKNESNSWKYDFSKKEKTQIEVNSNLVYLAKYRVKWDGNKILFLYLNNDNQLGSVNTEFKVDGVSKA